MNEGEISTNWIDIAFCPVPNTDSTFPNRTVTNAENVKLLKQRRQVGNGRHIFHLRLCFIIVRNRDTIFPNRTVVFLERFNSSGTKPKLSNPQYAKCKKPSLV